MPALTESEMTMTCRVSTTAALMVCLVATQLSGTLVAQNITASNAAALVSVDDQTTSPTERPHATGEPSRFLLSNDAFDVAGPLAAVKPPVWSALTFVPTEPGVFGQRGYGGRGRGGRHFGAKAVALGTIASIACAAVLVYANRPECSANHSASGCGYGTKVVGGAVLSAGLVGIVVGALTWR
jgi:hypothetical protein